MGAVLLLSPTAPERADARARRDERQVTPASAADRQRTRQKRPRPRGITPPWREHAIPEMRSQPGRRAKKFYTQAPPVARPPVPAIARV